MNEIMQLAIAEAQNGLSEGGISIDSVLVKNIQIVGQEHNKRVQENNPILHGEMDCLNNADRIGSYGDTVIYSTLMPCYMCAGTIVQFKIPKVNVGESQTFSGACKFMEAHGVEVIDLNLPECINMMQKFYPGKAPSVARSYYGVGLTALSKAPAIFQLLILPRPDDLLTTA